MKIKTIGYLALVVAIIISSSTTLAYKVGSNLPVFQFVFWIALVGTIASAVVMFATKNEGHLRGMLRSRTQLFSLVGVGVLIYAVITLVFAYATHYADASLVAVVYRTWPLMLVVLAPFMLREKITWWDLLGVAIGFSGVAAISVVGASVGLPLALLPVIGVVLIAALSDAVGDALQKRYNYEIYSSLFVYNLVSLVIFGALALYTGQLTVSGMNPNDIYVVLFLGVLQNVALTFFFITSLRTVKTSVFSNAFNISPFITIVLSYIILGEAIQPAYLIIAFTVLAGLAVQRLAPRGANYISKSGSSSTMPAIYDITSAFVNTKNQKIFDVMKGNGRVLAFYIDDPPTQDAVISRIVLESAKGEEVVLMTNRTNSGEISADEMSFVKEIIGHQDNDLVVLGVGEPGLVEKKFSELGELRKAQTSSPRQ